MTAYYFDIETYSPNIRPDPVTDKIITIQYQEIDLETGQPIKPLVILKEWESSEKEIVSRFYNEFLNGKSVWNFVPVGFNLNFDFEFLREKIRKYVGNVISARNLYYYRPRIDLKPIVVLLNNGEFKGASLDNFTRKPHNGSVIRKWYETQQYDEILTYIKEENEAFMEFLRKIIVLFQEIKRKL